jgi:hypothetical protein
MMAENDTEILNGHFTDEMLRAGPRSRWSTGFAVRKYNDQNSCKGVLAQAQALLHRDLFHVEQLLSLTMLCSNDFLTVDGRPRRRTAAQ